MTKLTNDLTWSVSRANLFSTCPRAYYYSYYGSWEGWSFNAPAKTRELYMLKQIKTLILWAGSIVHDTIKQALTDYSRNPIPENRPTFNSLSTFALGKMRDGWREAVAKLYLDKPKSTNLFELFYGNGQSLPKELTDSIKARVLESLENFASSAVLTEITSVPVDQWKPIDTLDTFSINDLKVWCAVDFAYTDSQGILHIIDWKTGSEHVEELRLQLACYALYAMDQWHATLDTIQLHGVFLRDGARKSNYAVNSESLITAKDQILSSAQAMRSKIKDVDNNLVDEEDFQPSPSERACSSCGYRKVCPAFASNNN